MPFLSQNPDQRESRHVAFVRDFSSITTVLHEKVTTALDVNSQISDVVEELKICTYDPLEFSSRLNTIQTLVSTYA
jgi:dynein heavy chain 1